MAFPTAVNDAKSKKFITTPISEFEINGAFKAVQSKDAAGPITSDVLVAFVQYVAQQLADNDSDIDATASAMATQILNYLQGYDGANKRCIVFLMTGAGSASSDVAPSNGVMCGWLSGCFGGVNQTYGIGCHITWD